MMEHPNIFERSVSQIEQRFAQPPDKRVGQNRFIQMVTICIVVNRFVD